MWEYAPAISSYSWSSGTLSSVITVSTSGNYTATVTNVAGNVATATQSVDVCVGLMEQSDFTNSSLRIYPNPNTGTCVLKNAPNGIYTLTDACGRVLETFVVTASYQTLEINNLAEGLYYLKSRFGTAKMVVIH
jgi:hypothetical protein